MFHNLREVRSSSNKLMRITPALRIERNFIMALPVALQLYSVRDEMEKDPKGTLTKVAEMGYNGVEIYSFAGLEPSELKSFCDSIGLKIMSSHGGSGYICDQIDETIEKMKTVGSKYMALAYLDPDKRPGTDGFEAFVSRMSECCKKAKAEGVQILYHNHEYEFLKFGDKYILDHILDSVGDGLLMPELDTCWINIGGENPEAFLKKYSGRCPVVHLKDFWFKERFGPEVGDKSEYGFETRPVGYGRQDMPGILLASEEIGAEWVVVEQDAPALGLDTIECAALSRRYLARLGW